MCTVCMLTQTFDPLRHGPDQPIFADINESSDAAEDISTTYTMAVGDSFLGNIASSTDEDWIRVELTEGIAYEFAHNGISLSDPLVRLYDASGTEIASDDDGGAGLNSLIIYTPTTTGTYYISADAFGSNIGTYELSLSEDIPLPPPGTTGTLEELGTFLMEGTSGVQRTYNTSQSNQITVNLSGLTADGQQLARWAMEAWEMVADLDFVEVSSGEMITVDDEDSGAFAFYPNSGSTSTANGYNTDGVELNVTRSWLTNSGTTLDSYSFQTYVHEFGHALGLNHQGNYNFDPNGPDITYQNSAYFTNDSWQMSVMSYFSQTENTSTDASYAYTSGAMMADIWAIQEFYGAPDENSATAGDTTYGAGSTLGNYMDEIFDWLSTGNTTTDVTGNLMAYTVYDRDGIDTFNFGFSVNDARLDMRGAQFSDFGNLTGILGIAQGTVIENAILGSGNDTVTGNTAANNIITSDGNDVVTGDRGNDTIIGGEGNDSLNGGGDADSVSGGNGDDTILGGSGYDTLRGGAGNDTINGGDGRDSVFMGG
ncbi:M10 family metallopeptidase C-terminal domain-containing protein, partial [uncultured Tateyamaria sp.]